MLRCAVAFFAISIVAAVLGFSGIAAGASGIAQICFLFFIVAFVVSLVWGLKPERKGFPPV